MGLHCTSIAQWGRGNSVLIREAVKKGKAVFKDSEVSWSSDW